jgi:hypothetical protein
MDINGAFKATCKILFKREVGELEEFRDYLLSYAEPLHTGKTVSGKEVHYCSPYEKGVRLVDYAEAFSSSPAAIRKSFAIDAIKDIDSLLGEVRERAAFAGNKILGKSEFVESSDSITDCSVIRGSADLLRCEYVAYSFIIRDSKYIFGSSHFGATNFCINVCATNICQRCVETSVCFYSSDAYYSQNCRSCHEVMFSFDQRSKNNLIGNNKLEKSAYLKLKEALLEQMADELEQKKRLPTILELLPGGSK